MKWQIALGVYLQHSMDRVDVESIRFVFPEFADWNCQHSYQVWVWPDTNRDCGYWHKTGVTSPDADGSFWGSTSVGNYSKDAGIQPDDGLRSWLAQREFLTHYRQD
jgi:hypothetical protein